MDPGIKELDVTSFESALRSTDKLVVVEFYSTACPSCAAIAPVYEEISKELKENAVFAKIDAQQNMPLAMLYGVMATPTFKFLCKNKPVGELVGEVNATLLRNTIKDLIRHRDECTKSTKLVFEQDGYG